MMIKSKMDEINSMDIMCATEVEEFFYKNTEFNREKIVINSIIR